MAFGVLLRITTHKEKWAIIAPTEEKARIIMDYIIDHIFDDALFVEQLDYHGSKEQLKQERSKTRITFRDGGEVRVFSGNANNSQQTKKALMGFGAPNIILDESSLIPDDLYSTVKRMVGGSSFDSFLLEIGNPFFRNHFHRTWMGARYVKVFCDVYKALKEGRYSPDYIEEMREEAYFDVLYECLFPAAEEVLPNGYRRLVSDAIVDASYLDAMPALMYVLDENGEPQRNKWGFQIVDDRPVVGVDPSGSGSNETRIIVRFPKHGFAMVAKVLTTEDLEIVADALEEVIHQWNIEDYHTVIDEGGVGWGLPAIMRRRGYLVKAVLFGSSTPETDKGFLNMRAYMYWQMRKGFRDIDNPLKLVRDPGFEEVKVIMYRQTSTDKTQMEPKEEMIKRNAADGKKVASPDTADGLVLTFVDTSRVIDEDDLDLD